MLEAAQSWGGCGIRHTWHYARSPAPAAQLLPRAASTSAASRRLRPTQPADQLLPRAALACAVLCRLPAPTPVSALAGGDLGGAQRPADCHLTISRSTFAEGGFGGALCRLPSPQPAAQLLPRAALAVRSASAALALEALARAVSSLSAAYSRAPVRASPPASSLKRASGMRHSALPSSSGGSTAPAVGTERGCHFCQHRHKVSC